MNCQYKNVHKIERSMQDFRIVCMHKWQNRLNHMEKLNLSSYFNSSSRRDKGKVHFNNTIEGKRGAPLNNSIEYKNCVDLFKMSEESKRKKKKTKTVGNLRQKIIKNELFSLLFLWFYMYCKIYWIDSKVL